MRAALVRSSGLVCEFRQAHFAHEDFADLLAVLVQRGRDDVRWLVMAELDDHVGEVGFDAG